MAIGPLQEPRIHVTRAVENVETLAGRAHESRGAIAPHEASPFSTFSQVLAGLVHEVDAGDGRVRGVIGAASGGGDLSPGELIVLQARVYRYSEAVDLTSRLIDHATSAIKTVLQGQ